MDEEGGGREKKRGGANGGEMDADGVRGRHEKFFSSSTLFSSESREG